MPETREQYNARKAREHRDFRKAHPEIMQSRDRRDWLWKAYKVTPAWFDNKLAEQGGTCALCDGTHDHNHWRTKRKENLHVDHDHRTKRARGILCTLCNKRLGQFELLLTMAVNIEPQFGSWLDKALNYLHHYRREHGDSTKE